MDTNKTSSKRVKANLSMLGVYRGTVIEEDKDSYLVELDTNKYFTHPVYILKKDILEVYEPKQHDSSVD